MYIERQQIKGISFSAEQKKLKYLFQNKKIQQFIEQVIRLQKQNKQVSPQAIKFCQFFKQISIKNERAMQIIRSPKLDWKVNKIDDKSQLAVRVTGTNVQLRYEGILSTNIQNLSIMIYQVNLFNNWVPFCTKSQDLLEVSPLQKICYLQFKMPFLAQRYAYFYGLGIDRIDHNGTIVIYGQGITQNETLMKKYNIKPDKNKIDKMVVLDLKFFICQISYKSESQFVFKCYTELDSHMPILPGWIVNAVIKQMGGFIFDRIIKQSQKFSGSIWEKQKNKDSNNPFYPWLHKRIDSWYEMKRKQTTANKNTKL